MSTTVADLKLHRIQPHDRNVRRDLGDLDELTDSIQAQGVLQPLIVAPFDGIVGQHVIIAGHRRYAAAQAAGLLEVPCVIRHDLDTQAKQIAAMLTENLQRTDLTPIEEACAYEQLDLLGLTTADMAQATGRSRRTVEARLRLMRLPEGTRDLVDRGQLTLDDADLVAKHADDPEMMAAVAKQTSAANIRWAIRSIEMSREHAQQVANRPPEDTRQAAERDAAAVARAQEVEAQRAAYQRRADILRTSDASTQQFILDRWKAGDKKLTEQLARFLLVDALRAGYDDLDQFGFPGPGEDEDEADWAARSEAAIRKLPAATAIATYVAWAFHATSVGYPRGENLQLFAELTGYELSDDERELIAQDVT